ncbi:hypothetical protein EDC45_1411 [Mesocricetibacter intestinalis]|uniref:Pyridoxal phosphatase n=1 Tax=Mesocricetibacter intestinalis TaxID=1521930 RepID=A0A4R6V7B0_9PAST|nr:pyridoxal phosphatase [Mesocricetibacter intestinalis]TDQ57357.1 hypothetical protein EDC45_1411 [Mesocricetibacter intestinalis]
MTYQAIAFDLDGTLLDSTGNIQESSKKAIQHARRQGLKVILVTGRHHTAVKPYYYELALDTPMICCNGTYLYQPQNDQVLAGNPLSKAQAEKVIDLAQRQGVHLLMYSRDAMNYMQLNPHMENFKRWVQSCPPEVRPELRQITDFRRLLEQEEIIWKFVISAPDPALMKATEAQLSPDEFSCEWSWIDRIDIANRGNSKGARLLELLQRWNIDPQHTIAFGDNHNDISMLTAVGLGVAMGNAEEAVKQQAKQVTLSNNEEGIAHLLNQLL